MTLESPSGTDESLSQHPLFPAVETRSRFPQITVTRFFTPRGFAILQSELLWIWLPAILFAAMVVMLRRKSQPDVVMPNE